METLGNSQPQEPNTPAGVETHVNRTVNPEEPCRVRLTSRALGLEKQAEIKQALPKPTNP